MWHVTLQHKEQRFLLMAWWSTSFTQLLSQHASSIRKNTTIFINFTDFQNIIQFYWINTHYAEQNLWYCYMISHLNEVPLHLKKNRARERQKDRPFWLKWQLSVSHQLSDHSYVFQKPLTLNKSDSYGFLTDKCSKDSVCKEI